MKSEIRLLLPDSQPTNPSTLKLKARQAGLATGLVVFLFTATLPCIAGEQNGEVARLTAILQSNAEQKEKADACRELARLGTKEAVPALAALLGDERLSHMARYGLETIPDAAVDTAFRKALDQLQGRQLVGVIGSIGVRHDTRAVKALTKFLTSSDPDVAQAAARALGKIATPGAVKALQRALPATPPVNGLAFYEGLFRCAEQFGAQGKLKSATAIYDWARKQSPELHQVRTAALRGAVVTRGPNGLPILLEALRLSDYPSFAAAARISHELPGEAITRGLAGELPKVSGDKAILLLQTLGRRRDPAALPAIFQVARAGDKSVRVTALHTISEFCDVSAVPVFLGLIEDSEPEVAQAAAEGLAALPGKQADDAILAMLKEANANRRTLGLDLVGRRRLAAAEPELLSIARGQDPALRVAAIRRLADLCGPRELPTLIGLLNQAQSPAELEAAEHALGAVAAKAEKPEASADILAAPVAQAPPAQKCALLRVLGSVGGGSALRAMRTGLKDSSAEVRATALRALGAWNNADPAADLLECARTCTDPAEKALALRSYLSLAQQAEISVETRLNLCKEAASLVQQEEDKKVLLGALGGIASPEAITLLDPYFEDAATRNEAAAACVAIADKLLKSKDAATVAGRLVAPLQKAAEAGAGEQLAQRARTLLEQARKQGK